MTNINTTLLSKEEKWEALIKDSLLWDEMFIENEDSKTAKNFEDCFKCCIRDYNGKENIEDFWNGWANSIKDIMFDGASICRVMFLEDIGKLDVKKIDRSSPWTLLDLLSKENMDIISYLQGNAIEIGKSTEKNKPFLLKAHCPKDNIHIRNVPIPNEHSEKEVNIEDNNKLSLVTVYEEINGEFDKVGVLNLKTGKLTLKMKEDRIEQEIEFT